MTPGGKPEVLGRSQGEVHIFNINIIDYKRFQVDWLKTLGRVHYTKLRKNKYISVWAYVLRPLTTKILGRGRSKGEVHIFNTYINDCKRFQVDRLKTLGQVHYTKPEKNQ